MRSYRRWLLLLAVFCWPFVFLHAFVFPADGSYRAIGNDFIDSFYLYKAYLLDHLANLRFPLWSPAEAAGFPFYSNPFPQPFYPLNIPLAAFYRLFGGYTPADHQAYTVLGVAI
ncbi:MAG: hypothetical protein WC943_14795, partial [Elusimicrobiota bacterium]